MKGDPDIGLHLIWFIGYGGFGISMELGKIWRNDCMRRLFFIMFFLLFFCLISISVFFSFISISLAISTSCLVFLQLQVLGFLLLTSCPS